MDSKTYLKKQVESMWYLQDSALDGLTDEILMKRPAGTVSPIGVIWLHMAAAQDNFTAVLSGQSPIWQNGWSREFGINQTPDIGEDWTAFNDLDLKVDLLREYSQAVRQFTRKILEETDERSLDETIKMFTDQDPKADVWVLMIGHTLLHCGEIAALKGAFGEQGLPF